MVAPTTYRFGPRREIILLDGYFCAAVGGCVADQDIDQGDVVALRGITGTFGRLRCFWITLRSPSSISVDEWIEISA